MKTLSENYTANHSNTHETFADLVFCALVVLVLFVVMLAVEVSQRVRANIVSKEAIPEVPQIENIETMSPEKVKDFVERLRNQQQELESRRQRMLAQEAELQEYRQRIANQESSMANRMAALNGEQRFTGATEPATVQLAYDYYQDRFVFVRIKEFEHAVTRQAGESNLEFSARSERELVALALLSRKQRFYSAEETNKIYAAFTTYQQINPTETSFTISNEKMSVKYGPGLSAFISGDASLTGIAQVKIEDAINSNLFETAGLSEAMYPSANVQILLNQRRIILNEVSLTAKDFRDVLLSIGGRGVMLDFSGYNGSAPGWLVEEVLTPTGYIGKTPKAPEY